MYKKGFDDGYKAGFDQAYSLVIEKIQGSIEFAGAIRKKQMAIIENDLRGQISSIEKIKPTCNFSTAWVGSCKSVDILDNGQCSKHQEKCSCGKLATNTCAHAGQLVCGRPLCDDCSCKH